MSWANHVIKYENYKKGLSLVIEELNATFTNIFNIYVKIMAIIYVRLQELIVSFMIHVFYQ